MAAGSVASYPRSRYAYRKKCCITVTAMSTQCIAGWDNDLWGSKTDKEKRLE